MSKKFLLLAFMSAFALAACDMQEEATNEPHNDQVLQSDENSNPVVESPQANSNELDEYVHDKYTVSYPSDLETESLFSGPNDVVYFKDQAGETVMEVRAMEGDRVGFLSAMPTGNTLAFQNGEWIVGVNQTGYCDGPGCGDPFVSYGYYDQIQNQTYVLTFFNQTEENDRSRAVAKSFELSGLKVFEHQLFSIGYPANLKPVESSKEYISFVDENGLEWMSVRIDPEEFAGMAFHEKISDLEFAYGNGAIWTVQGYCDGPAEANCAEPRVAYSFYNGEWSYVITVIGSAEETDQTGRIRDSFKLVAPGE